MGSDETATATTGGPRVIDVFDRNGAPSGPNGSLFRTQIGSRTPSGLGLRSGSRLERMRRFSVLPESSGSKTLANHGQQRHSAKDLAYMYPPMEAPAHAA